MRDCRGKSPIEYGCRLLRNGIPAVHVLRDLAIRMENLFLDTDDDESKNLETGPTHEQNNYLTIFEALDDHSGDNNDKGTVPSDTNIFESLDSATATNHIWSHIHSFQDFQ